jgi:antitoxin (DNA-binding transcriptional repressor) of toxin-antitoxin stability system
MRSTSVRELHIHTSALVQDAADGATIIIERRGTPVAELRPLSNSGKVSAAAIKKSLDRMEKFWAGRPHVPFDSTRFVEEDRDR